MEPINTVMYAGALIWASIGAYLFILCKKQALLVKRIEHLSQLEED